MKAQTRIRINMVKEALMGGFPIHEIVSQLSGEFGIAPSSMRYFITRANREINDEMYEGKMLMENVRAAILERQATGLMATEEELDGYLTQLVRGELKEEKVISTTEGAKIVRVAVSGNERLKLIEKLYNRLGVITRFQPAKPKEASGKDIITLLKLLDADSKRGYGLLK